MLWVEECNRTGEDLLSASFNDAAVTEYTHKLRNDKHEMDAAKSQDPSKPEALKATKDWMKWFEKFKNYLGQIRGAARIPLTYIIRNHLDVNNDLRNAEYGSTIERLIAITSLNGMHFEIDNKQVWQEVKALVIDGLNGVILSNLNDSLMVEELYWHYASNVKVDLLCLLTRIKLMQA